MPTTRTLLRRAVGFFVAIVVGGCSTSDAAPALTTDPSTMPVTRAASSRAVLGAPPVLASYPWPHESAPADRLDVRFPTPAGFTRATAPRASFAEFLRTLPLKADGAPVVDYRARRLYASDHPPNIAAVADIDVGTKDLQHCADAIIRLDAEWRYGRGDRDMAYRSLSGQTLAYKSYLAGERARGQGNGLVFERTAARTDNHTVFRAWLDDVFAWAGTASIERDGKHVASLADAKGGDFFVMSGAPFGHAVLILDVARDEHGRAALLLGQSYMPAQSFQVLSPDTPDGSAWFVVEPGDDSIRTPFWRPFPLTSLRRF